MIIEDAFLDVSRKPIPPGETKAGLDYLDRLAALQIGQGSSVFRADQSGMWLGAAKFADAPFRVAMDGTVVVGSGYSKINIFRQAAIPTSVSAGDLWFDSDDNNRMYRAASAGADEVTAGEWEEVATPSISVFAQTSIPTSLAEGDLWYDTDDNNKPYRAASVGADQITAGEWEAVDDQRAADALLKSGASQALTGDFNLNDTNVTIDGTNKRILINDGTNPRILIGYHSGGF